MVTQLLCLISFIALIFWVLAFAESVHCEKYNDLEFEPYD